MDDRPLVSPPSPKVQKRMSARLQRKVLKTYLSCKRTFSEARSPSNEAITLILVTLLGMLGHFSFTVQPLIEAQVNRIDYSKSTMLIPPLLWTIGVFNRSSVFLIFGVPSAWLFALSKVSTTSLFSIAHLLWLMLILGGYLIVSIRYCQLKIDDHFILNPWSTRASIPKVSAYLSLQDEAEESVKVSTWRGGLKSLLTLRSWICVYWVICLPCALHLALNLSIEATSVGAIPKGSPLQQADPITALHTQLYALIYTLGLFSFAVALLTALRRESERVMTHSQPPS